MRGRFLTLKTLSQLKDGLRLFPDLMEPIDLEEKIGVLTVIGSCARVYFNWIEEDCWWSELTIWFEKRNDTLVLCFNTDLVSTNFFSER